MGRKKSYSRDEAAESALEVFWEKGFERTSLRDLELATGVNRYGLYDSFKDKQGLFRECLEHYCSNGTAMISSFMAEGFDGLIGLIARFSDVGADNAHLAHGCLAVSSMLERDGLSADTQELLGTYMEGVLASIRAVLEQEQAAGRLRAELDLEECVQFVHMCLLGLPTMSRTAPDSSSMRLAAKAALTTLRSWRV